MTKHAITFDLPKPVPSADVATGKFMMADAFMLELTDEGAEQFLALSDDEQRQEVRNACNHTGADAAVFTRTDDTGTTHVLKDWYFGK